MAHPCTEAVHQRGARFNSCGCPTRALRQLAQSDEVTVKGLHFIREGSPDEIDYAMAGWLSALEQDDWVGGLAKECTPLWPRIGAG
jgi:hypothetical protein